MAIEIERTCTLVGLENELNKQAKKLSGGMKKRLSIAMALIGNSKVKKKTKKKHELKSRRLRRGLLVFFFFLSKIIILDEPSSGLDPFNRQLLWNILNRYKKNRTIILTTHYMEGKTQLT